MTDKQPEALESLASSIGAAPYSIDADPQGQEGERDYPFLPTSVGDVEDWGDGKARNVTWSNAPPSGGTSLYTADQMRAYVDADRAIRASHGQAPAQAAPVDAIASILNEVMEIAVSNGANSVSMPDHYVEVAAWLAAAPTTQPAPQQEAQEPCPSCRNSDIYACTCTFPKSRNTAPQPSPAAQEKKA